MSTDPHAPTPAGPEPTPTVPATDATAEHPVAPAAPEGDWLAPTPPAEPEPEPVIATPSAFTPPGTPEPEGPSAQVAAVVERPEVQVGLAFAGGAALSFLLRGLGR